MQTHLEFVTAMKQPLKYIFSILLTVSPLLVSGQALDSARAKSKFSFDIALDYGKILTLPSGFEKKMELAAGVTIKGKLQLIGELGYGKLTPEEAIKNGSYESAGIYYRAGLAYGGEIIPKNYLLLGLMYGMSDFEDRGTVIIQSEVCGDNQEHFHHPGLTATWYEIILISEQEINDRIFLGSKFRLRNLRSFENDYEPEVYSIPGYGRTFDKSIPAFNLFVKYRLKL